MAVVAYGRDMASDMASDIESGRRELFAAVSTAVRDMDVEFQLARVAIKKYAWEKDEERQLSS